MGTVAVDSTLALTNSKQRRSAPNCSNASFIKIQLKVKLYTVEDRVEISSGHPLKMFQKSKVYRYGLKYKLTNGI